jgi:hypothetical protein
MRSVEVAARAFRGEFQSNVTPARLMLTSTGATPTAEDQTHLFEFLSKAVALQVQFVCVFDLREFGLPSPSLLRGLGAWCKAHEKEFQSLQLAIAILLKDSFWSGAVKKMIGVVTAICPPTCPLLTCHNLESAESFFSEKVVVNTFSEFARVPSRKDAIPRVLSLQSNDSCNIEPEESAVPYKPPRFVAPHSFADSLLRRQGNNATKEHSLYLGAAQDWDTEGVAVEDFDVVSDWETPVMDIFDGHVTCAAGPTNARGTRSAIQHDFMVDADLPARVPSGKHTRTGLHQRNRARKLRTSLVLHVQDKSNFKS